MRFTLTVQMDNDAFGVGDFERADELARILHKLAARFGSDTAAGPDDAGSVKDENGNTVGRWEVLES